MNIKEYSPFLIAGGVAFAGIYLARRDYGAGSKSGYTTIPGADNSGQQAAVTAARHDQLEATVNGFNVLATFANANADRAEEFRLTQSNNEAAIRLSEIDAQNQRAAIKSGDKASRRAVKTQAITTLGSIAIAAFMFCYNESEYQQKARLERGPYLLQ